MVFSRRATVYLWSLHFLFSDVQKRTSNPAPCSAGVLLSPPRLLSLLPWHRCRKWLTLLTAVLTKTHIFKGRQIFVPSPLRSGTVRFQTLITLGLQSKQLIANARRAHYWPSVFQAFPITSSLPPHSWLRLALKHFCRRAAPLSSPMHANPRLDYRLMGF